MTNKNHKLFISFVALVLMLYASGSMNLISKDNQSKTNSDNRQLFDKYIDTVNVSALNKFESFKITGVIQVNDPKPAEFEFYYLKPDCMRLYLLSNRNMVYSTDGKEDYLKIGTMPSETIKINVKAMMKYLAMSIEGIVAGYDSTKSIVKFLGNDTIKGINVAKYDFFGKDGLSKELSISLTNNLVYKVNFIDQVVDLSFPVTIFYKDYLKSDGKLYPKSIEIIQDDLFTTITIMNVIPDYKLNKSDFKKPYGGY